MAATVGMALGLVVVVLAAIHLHELRVTVVTQAGLGQATLVRLLANELARQLTTIAATLGRIDEELTNRELDGWGIAPGGTNAILANELVHLPLVRSLSVVAPDGLVSASSERRNLGLTVPEVRLLAERPDTRPQFGAAVPGADLFQAMETPLAARPETPAVGSHFTINVGTRPQGPMVVAVLNTAAVVDAVHHFLEDPQDPLLLLRFDGALVAGNRDRVPESFSTILLSTYLPTRAYGQFEHAGSDGSGWLVSFRTLHEAPLVVAVALPLDRVEVRWRNSAVAPLMLAAAFLMAILVSVVLLMRLMRDQELAIEGLIRQEERMRSIFDNALEGFVASDAKGLIRQFNPAAERIFGWTAAEMIGQPLERLVKSAAGPVQPDEIDRSRPVGAGLGGPVVGVRRDGTEVQLLLSLSEVGAGADRLFTAVIRDVTADRIQAEERRHLWQAVDQCPVSIAITDRNGLVTYVNPKFISITGLDRSEIIGRTYDFTNAASSPDQPGCFWLDKEPRQWRGQCLNQRRDGTSFWERILISPGLDDSGTVSHFIVIKEDISQEKEAELSLERSRHRLQLVLDATSDGVWDWDLQTHDIDFSERYRQLLGYSDREKFDRDYDFAESIHPDDLGRVIDAQQRCFGDGCRFDETWRMRISSGGYRWFHGRGAAVLGPAGVERILGAVTDITAIKEIEAEYARARDAADAANRAKSEFLAMMSHEIRTPLNGVIGMAGVLAETRIDAEQRQMVGTILHSAEALLRVIDDILDFSKIEAGRLEIEVVEFDLATLVGQALAMVAERARQKGLATSVTIDQEAGGRFAGDAGRIRQVLLNLLSNAVKFTTRGSITVAVAAESAEAPNGDARTTLSFTITDTGIGIAESDLPRLFNRFTQLDTTPTRRFGGTGLGLAISRRLVEMMGGRITVESTLGQGSRFQFAVPLTRALADGSAPTQVAVTAKPIAADPSIARRLRVLVVEDNPVNRRVMVTMVGRLGHACDVAENGAEAVQAVRRQPYDVVLMDLQMPEMDGFEATQAIRALGAADPVLARLKIIAITANAFESDRRQCMAAGMDEHLAKPVGLTQLRQVLARLIPPRDAPAPPTVPAAERARPDRPSEEPHRPTDSEAAIRVLSAPAPTPAPATGAIRPTSNQILVVDDNLVNQTVARAMLKKLGITVEVVTTAEEALERMATEPFDLVLMDIELPGIDGYEATRRLRADPAFARLPVIAMSAHDDADHRSAALAAGMNDILGKPMTLQQMAALLRRWLPGPPEPSRRPAPPNLAAPQAAHRNAPLPSAPEPSVPEPEARLGKS